MKHPLATMAWIACAAVGLTACDQTSEPAVAAQATTAQSETRLPPTGNDPSLPDAAAALATVPAAATAAPPPASTAAMNRPASDSAAALTNKEGSAAMSQPGQVNHSDPQRPASEPAEAASAAAEGQQTR